MKSEAVRFFVHKNCHMLPNKSFDNRFFSKNSNAYKLSFIGMEFALYINE